MIVKRVAVALRRQDWTAVTIEFFLVVAGVLLAFQINEWANQREARAEQTAATVRLLDEAELTVAYMRAGVDIQRSLVADLDYTLGRIQNGHWPGADRNRMTRALLGIVNAAPPAPPSSVYDDLVASGGLGKIGDVQLRSAVADYRATLDFNSRFVDYFRHRMPNFAAYGALRYDFAEGQPGRVRLQVNFPALAKDRELQEALALAAGGQEIMLRTRQRTLRQAEKMCMEIGRFAAKPCNLQRTPPNFN
jgi:hypothetical protein